MVPSLQPPRQAELAERSASLNPVGLDLLRSDPHMFNSTIAGGRAALIKYLSLAPGTTVSGLRRLLPIRSQASLEMVLDGLRRRPAGLMSIAGGSGIGFIGRTIASAAPVSLILHFGSSIQSSRVPRHASSGACCDCYRSNAAPFEACLSRRPVRPNRLEFAIAATVIADELVLGVLQGIASIVLSLLMLIIEPATRGVRCWAAAGHGSLSRRRTAP
jgi:hypothetical protein